MKSDHLHLFINEDIYLVDEPATSSPVEEVADSTPAIEPSVQPPTIKEKETAPSIPKISSPQKEKIPEVPPKPAITLPFGFYASINRSEEKELLDKIIAACKLPASDYKIFEDDLSNMRSKKAIVFSDDIQPVKLYQQLKIEQTDVIYSKSLATLMASKDDKLKLWGVLQSFTK